MAFKSLQVDEVVHCELKRLKRVSRWPLSVIVEKAVALLKQHPDFQDDSEVVAGGVTRRRTKHTPSRSE